VQHDEIAIQMMASVETRDDLLVAISRIRRSCCRAASIRREEQAAHPCQQRALHAKNNRFVEGVRRRRYLGAARAGRSPL
jgi:hypothetical protein